MRCWRSGLKQEENEEKQGEGGADNVARVEGVGVKQTRAVITPESGSTRPTL